MKRRGRPRHPDVLTVREWEVLELLREDLSNEAIADRLAISAETVKSHVSSILLKLGVETRREAAAWRPERARTGGLLGLLAVFRRLHLGSLSPAVGGAAVVVVAAGVAALLWGVLATGGASNSAGSDRWSYSDSTTGAPSVMLFDLSKHEAKRLDVGDDVRVARWVKPGESFVAHGAAVDNYPIFALSGGKVLTMSLQGDLTKEVVPAPDGSALVVGRTDNQYVVSNIPNGNGPTLATGATDLAFSPDGRQAAWTGLGNLDKDGNFHRAGRLRQLEERHHGLRGGRNGYHPAV